MSKEIEELFKDLSNAPAGGVKEDFTIVTMKDKYTDMFIRIISGHMAAEGYRKQVEGEWIKDSLVGDTVICSLCGYTDHRFDYDQDEFGSKYCPNCGAKMKGGA